MDVEFIRSPEEMLDYSQTTNSEVGTKACPAAEKLFKWNSYTSVSWKSFASDGIRSLVECLEMFNDKSQVTLFDGLLLFYALHATLLYFSEGRRRKLVANGKTFVTYCLVKLGSKNVTSIHQSAVVVGSSYMTKVEKLSTYFRLH